MEEANKTSARSISPFENSYDTSTDKELYPSQERNTNPNSRRRIIPNEYLSKKIDSPPTATRFCGNCIRLERNIHDLTKKLQKEKKKNENREKHAKQLYSLLQIKDKRLKEEENSLKIEKNSISHELEDLKQLIKDIQHEKSRTENENKRISKENANLIVALKKTETKYVEIQKIIKKYEEEKKNLEETLRSQILKNFESRESNLKKKESEISLEYQKINYENELMEEKKIKLSYIEQNLMIQDQSFKLKYEELSNFSNELEESKEKLQQDQQEFEEKVEKKLNTIESCEKNLQNQENSLKLKFSKLDIELQNIESLKTKLNDQRAILDKEINNYRELQQELMNQPIHYTESEADDASTCQEKEKYIDEMIEKLTEEERKFSERWAGFKKTEESMKNEIEYFKRKNSELEQKLNIKSTEEFAIPLEYQEKLFSLQNKEEELINLENTLNKERQDIDATADLVKSLNDDLLAQKKIQDEEYERINKEKERLVDMLKRQEERAKLLSLKEQDLLKFRDSLIDLEKSYVSDDNIHDQNYENKGFSLHFTSISENN